MISATIFARDDKWLKKSESGVLDVRFDAQALPAGCWVVAFIVWTPAGIQMVENVPHLDPVWLRRYRELRRYTIRALEEGWWEEPEWMK